MSATFIDGKEICKKVRGEVRDGDAEMKADNDGYTPGLATVLVGDDTASSTYVRMKQRACEAAGINSFGHTMGGDTTQEEVLALVSKLNADPAVHGILCSFPCPSISTKRPF